MESSPMCRKGEEKIQWQNRLTATTFPSFCVALLDARQKLWLSVPVELCGLMTHFRVWTLAAAWQHQPSSSSSEIAFIPAQTSQAVFVDIKKSNVIEESSSQGAFLAGFQSHHGSERSLRWGRNSSCEAWPFEVFLEKYPGSGCIQQKLTCGTGGD